MHTTSCQRTLPQLTDSLPKGTIFDGRFMITRRIARTKLSIVYEGRDLWSDARVIIKQLARVPRPGGLARAEALLLFKREAQMLTRLHHPQVPQLHAASISTTDAYIVMDYVGDMTLERFLKRITLPLPMALALCDRLCALVADIHAGVPAVLHNDLKPSNIMITADCQLFLVDFGLACLKGENWPFSVSLGTPDYIAPEAVRGIPLDERSDVFALGQVLLDILGPTATPTLLCLLRRATAKEPAARYATVAQLRQALRAAVIAQLKPADPPTDEWKRWLAAIIMALFGLCCIAYEQRQESQLNPNVQPLMPVITLPTVPGR